MELENMARVSDFRGGWELDQVNEMDLDKQSTVIIVVIHQRAGEP